ncbi:galactose mutarotase [Rhizobium sp. KVB221]|uniref:Aldose 1-epimerase n=1 Tax=Rhizobium setariae TaxID=2801340 RepID=A0A936YR04_9HYPH|nr:aldose epimerase family protein [Rhizobium setariae]MBL0372634.1 galactose mutarotase [Rhizobium setariae]
MTNSDVFGTGSNGETVRRVVLTGGGLTAHVLTWGAIIQDLRLEGHDAPLVLGFDAMSDYLAHSPYFGATPGRNSNRIADGRFAIDGTTYKLECNEKGVTHLHGGSDGIARQNWDIVELGESHVVLRIVDRDGRAGYPGNCTITCTYSLGKSGVLSVVYESTTDKPTIANVCQHSYFILDDTGDTSRHEMQIAADRYLPTDARQIPAGGPRAVDGTPFDFRQMKSVVQQQDGEQVLYDHNFCLSDQRVVKREVAHVHSTASGVNLQVATTEPGLQYYAAFKLDVPVPGLGGRTYGPFAGLCLETQIWPDAINQSGFPDAVLRPGEVLRQETDYIFSKGVNA